MTVNHAVESVAQGESPGGRRVCEGSLQEAEPHVVLWFRRSAKGGGKGWERTSRPGGDLAQT